jgi:hypothetical protein
MIQLAAKWQPRMMERDDFNKLQGRPVDQRARVLVLMQGYDSVRAKVRPGLGRYADRGSTCWLAGVYGNGQNLVCRRCRCRETWTVEKMSKSRKNNYIGISEDITPIPRC